MDQNEVALITDSKLTYSIPEACEAAGCQRSTLYREAHKGRVTIRKMGRKSFLLKADVVEWLESLPRAHFDSSEIDRPEGSVICRPGEPMADCDTEPVDVEKSTQTLEELL